MDEKQGLKTKFLNISMKIKIFIAFKSQIIEAEMTLQN